MTASNVYRGTTTISAGTLQIGNGTPSASLGTGTVVDNGVLVFDCSDTLTLGGVIGGSGSLVQNGGDVVILTGNNNYTGGTTILNGTLQVGAGGTTGSLGTGPVYVADTLAFNLSGSAAVANPISGGGSLVQAGTGFLTLLGASGFGGDLTVAAGTLQIGNGGSGASLAASSGVLDNGSLVFNHSDIEVFPGVISGSGGLVQTGGGLLALMGSNTYSGSTTISGGTLQVGHGGSGASIEGSSGVLDNGSLIFNNNDSTEFDGVISGSGSLTRLGPGTLILTGSNTYSGATTISAGTLQIGNGGSGSFLASPSIVLSATLAALVFNPADSPTYSGVISGIGNLMQAGPGTLVLTGNNTYSGATTISAGTLQIGNGGSGGSLGSGSVLDSGVLVFNWGSGTSFAGVISGKGGLWQAAPSVLTLLGNSTFSGGTTISAGTLQLGNGGTSGSLAGAVAVSAAAVLVLDRADNTSMNLALSGPGAVVKTASDTLTLTGNSSGFSGSINVVQGQLVLAGATSLTTCTAASGGTLTFSGGSFTLGPYGTVCCKPGGSSNSRTLRSTAACSTARARSSSRPPRRQPSTARPTTARSSRTARPP